MKKSKTPPRTLEKILDSKLTLYILIGLFGVIFLWMLPELRSWLLYNEPLHVILGLAVSAYLIYRYLKKPPAKRSRRLTVWVAVSLIMIATTNLFIIAISTDKTEEYTGAQLEAANFALDSFDPFDDGIGNVPHISRLRVRSVEFTPRSSYPACQDPTKMDSYTVTLETVTWFSIVVEQHKIDICQRFGG